MLLMLRVMLVMLVPGVALALDYRPAEMPPADFSARQYIDSKGCVFLRDDEVNGWKARVSRDGSPICGYPPTLSARGLDGKPRLSVLDPDAGRSPAEMLEEALAETVLTNLRPGELASDPTPMEKLPDMGPEPDISSAPSDALKAALAAAPDMRRSMGEALQPNKRLCELLGYDGTTGPAEAGADPSQGYCDSLPASDLSRLTFIRPVASVQSPEPAAETPVAVGTVMLGAPVAETHSATAPVAEPPTAPKAAEVAAMPKPKPPKPADASLKDKPKPQPVPKMPDAKRPVSAEAAAKAPAAKALAATALAAKDPVAAQVPAAPVAVATKPKPEAAPPTGAGMIPAGARYVQVGTYADAANADRAAQAIAAMGYPVLRGKDKVGARAVQF
ncbi:MAG: hypothetical protein KBG46_15455, partial [Paracoccus sp.]|nr:hypothetical protein [Paracoccus sp. (in: a-proteobacteria)]